MSEVTAIDILLEPDATMLEHAMANNARLLKVTPGGFPLDPTHTPHVSLMQCFVRTADLPKVYEAARTVVTAVYVKAMQFVAFKYFYFPVPGGSIGLAGIATRPTPELLKLQADLITAVGPFTVSDGDSSAFVTTVDDPVIDAWLIDYVRAFVPDASGKKYGPHVTTGIAPRIYLDQMLSEPFENFTYSPTGVAVYQLGQFGTAAKPLKNLNS